MRKLCAHLHTPSRMLHFWCFEKDKMNQMFALFVKETFFFGQKKVKIMNWSTQSMKFNLQNLTHLNKSYSLLGNPLDIVLVAQIEVS